MLNFELVSKEKVSILIANSVNIGMYSMYIFDCIAKRFLMMFSMWSTFTGVFQNILTQLSHIILLPVTACYTTLLPSVNLFSNL